MKSTIVLSYQVNEVFEAKTNFSENRSLSVDRKQSLMLRSWPADGAFRPAPRWYHSRLANHKQIGTPAYFRGGEQAATFTGFPPMPGG